MLNNDGDYLIYYIQHQWEDEEGWRGSELSAFLKDKAQEKDWEEFRKLDDGYGAGGKCWQTTGWYGSFDPEIALKLMHFVAGFNPGRKFRVVCISVSQTTVPFCSVEYNMKDWKLRPTPEEFG